MEKNQTFVEKFILLGLSADSRLQSLFFFIFLFMYVITASGNLLLIIVVRLDPVLQTPMYFFLSHLSVNDISMSTTIVPKMLANTISEDQSISFVGCAAQMYFHLSLGSTECLILGTMAYDRYNAICKPLHYTIIMNPKQCLCLTASCWTFCFVISMIHAVFTFQLPYCKSSNLNHFFCEIPPLLRLSCKDTKINEVGVFICGAFYFIFSFCLTYLSYFQIISTIVKIHSVQGRHKAFSTCSSHLIVVSLYFGTIMFMYMRPQSKYSPDQDRAAAVLYTVVTPMLNPIIYSVRNKDIKGTILKLIGKVQ
ncbi:olfactory receptor 2G3-like [Hyperolius riggenbachi]|uniref:olfactory receptor 2G3-like n=1 Tax=Hyperolius riggenbachi TaxID=752182 RepID=UPI0035A3AB7A